MSRFNEGYVFDDQSPMGPPATANILLTRLRVFFAPEDVQRAAVSDWLMENTASPRLREELALRGFTVQ